ncbi:MAG: tetratricopeptide repeat protein [Candidatus Margulisiibacteriota bacterium]
MKKSRNWNNSELFNFAMEILILIVIFIMPTIFDRRLGIVFSGTKTTWMRVLGSVILGVWAIKLIITRKHRFIRTPLDWPVCSFLLCTSIASLTSVHVYTSLVGFYGRYEGLSSWYLFGLFFFVITNYIKSFEQLKRITVTVMSAATLMAIYSIIQRHALDPYMWGGVITWQRVIGTIGQPNFLAAYMLMAFFLILAMFLMEKKWGSGQINWYEQLIPIGYFVFGQITFLFMIYTLEAHNFLAWYFGFLVITASALLFTFSYERLHPRIFNFVLGLSLVLIYICILYTQSRGAYMGFFTGAVLFVLVAGRSWVFANWKKIGILGFLIVLISGITMTRPEFSPFARFAGEITTAETKLELKGAAGSRGETWKSAFEIIANYPFFGIGPEVLKMLFPRYETDLFRFKEAFHVKQDRCHNETFDVGVTKGLITLLVYLWLLFTVFQVGWVKARGAKEEEKLILAGLLAAALAFLIQNQFSFGVVAITSLFWIMWGMLMVIGEGEEGKGEVEKGRKLSWVEIPWLPVAAVVILVIFLIYLAFFSFRGDIWFKAGKTRIGQRRFPQATQAFEKSLKVFPFEGSTVSHLGIAYLNLSRTTSEKKKFLDQAISTLKYGTQIDPYNADNFFMLSKIHLMQRDLSRAKEYAEIALKIDPYYAEVYHTLAMIYEAQGKVALAAGHFEKAFLINPNLTQPMLRLENLNRRIGRASQTLKVFERALDKYSNNLIILERVAWLYLEHGWIEKTLEISQTMIQIDPSITTAYILRAEVYLRKRDAQQAFSDFQQVILSDPKNVPAHIGLGRVYLLMGNQDRAREEFEQVLMLDAKNAYAKKMLGK